MKRNALLLTVIRLYYIITGKKEIKIKVLGHASIGPGPLRACVVSLFNALHSIVNGSARWLLLMIKQLATWNAGDASYLNVIDLMMRFPVSCAEEWAARIVGLGISTMTMAKAGILPTCACTPTPKIE